MLKKIGAEIFSPTVLCLIFDDFNTYRPYRPALYSIEVGLKGDNLLKCPNVQWGMLAESGAQMNRGNPNEISAT